MNNFPAMTEEQRQELVADCQAEIVEIEKALTAWGEGWTSYLQSKLTRQKIALAALTAEPVAYTDAEELETLRKASFADMFTPHEAYKADPLWMPLFPAPPAPVLKPIELPCADHETDDGYEFYRKETVIEAIRVAGYEVKQ